MYIYKARTNNRLNVFVGTTLSSFHSYSTHMLPVQQLIVAAGLCVISFDSHNGPVQLEKCVSSLYLKTQEDLPD